MEKPKDQYIENFQQISLGRNRHIACLQIATLVSLLSTFSPTKEAYAEGPTLFGKEIYSASRNPKIERGEPAYFNFSPEELRRLRRYGTYGRLFEKHSKSGMISRTFRGRLNDSIEFLQAVRRHRNPKLKAIFEALLANRRAPVFIDIGPGLANRDAPAVTTREMADALPDALEIVALDLPEEVENFWRNVSQQKRAALLTRIPNLKIVAGNGLHSMRAQLPEIPPCTPLIFRSANGMDIYVPWEDVEKSLKFMADEFFSEPILYFFNREIMFKPANSVTWSIIGRLNERGFRHNSRSLERIGPAFTLKTRD